MLHSFQLEHQLQLEAEAFADCAGGEDFREGVTAFAEKRKPKFKGRWVAVKLDDIQKLGAAMCWRVSAVWLRGCPRLSFLVISGVVWLRSRGRVLATTRQTLYKAVNCADLLIAELSIKIDQTEFKPPTFFENERKILAYS